MQESFRLLKECQWLLESMDDPDYPSHTLKQQKQRLEEQLDRHIAALEADQQWSSRGDDSIFLLPRLPEGWMPQILEPSRELRFTARSPRHVNHRLIVAATDVDTLSEVAFRHDVISIPRAGDLRTGGSTG